MRAPKLTATPPAAEDKDKAQRRLENEKRLIVYATEYIALAENVIEGGDWARMPTWLARNLIDLAKLATKLKLGGRPRISRRDKTRDMFAVRRARRRSAELVAEGIPKKTADDKAATELQEWFKGRGRILKRSTIRRRMQSRR